MMIYCYWSEAALALADRQTQESEPLARKILIRRGSYLSPFSGELFPFPAPEPSPELIEKFPALANMPRDENAKSKLRLHREKQYEQILNELRNAGAIKFYDPATRLRIKSPDDVGDPIIYLDEVDKLIIEHAQKTAESGEASEQIPPQAAVAEQREQAGDDWITKARTIAIKYIARHKEQNLFPTQDDVCTHLEKELREKIIHGTQGRPPSAKYIKRNAIQGEWWQKNKP